MADNQRAPSARQSILVGLGSMLLLALVTQQVVRWYQNQPADPMVFQGEIMGTSYMVKAMPIDAYPTPEPVREIVHPVFAELERLLSTYREDSELSAVNRAPVQACVQVSADTRIVLRDALALSEVTNGQFDISVGPLVDLWGFGAAGPVDQPPTAEAIESTRTQVGYEAVTIDATDPRAPCVVKNQPRQLDLSAIAKGYAVDQVANIMSSLGFQSFLVELGGEIWAQGQKPNGEPWTVAIEVPLKHTLRQAPLHTLSLSEPAGMATSGDYRNFFEYEGKAYAHTIDPKTGYPVDNQIASVTVLAQDVTTADGWATALMASPSLERAQAYADEHQLAALFVQRAVSESDSSTPSTFNLVASERFCTVYGCAFLP